MTTVHRTRPLPGRLPAEVTEFLGRRGEVSDVKRLLAGARLVTLTGVGGCGKTRLAMRVADALRRGFADGVWLVDLATVTDPELIVYAVGDTVGVRDQSERLAVDVVVDFLADRQLLLVLDNCEHLLDGCAEFAGRALRDAPALRLLCTSRQPLGVVGEQVWTVPPLATPDPQRPVPPGAAAQFPALALFAARAAAVAPDFALAAANLDTVAEICHRLDGLPLAIELAAARLRVLSVDQLAAILRDGFPDLSARHATPAWHHTLGAAFDWSYRLCSPAERAAWARVSVFVDTFELAAAEEVAGSGTGLLDQLAGLVDKSVLVREEDGAGTRYRLLATVREYGLRRLRASGDEADLRRRHRDWYRRLASRFNAEWFGPDQVGWIRRITTELPNLRAALDFCAGTPGEVGEGLALAADLIYFWFGCGRLHEGHHWYERLLALEPRTGPARLAALGGLATILAARGEIDASTARAFEAAGLAQDLADEVAQSRATALFGTAVMMGGDVAAARTLLEKANARLTAVGDGREAVVHARLPLAVVLMQQGEPDLARAEDLLASCRATCQDHGEQWWFGYVLVSSALVALAGNDVPRATGYLRQSLRSRCAMGDTLGIASSVERLAWVAGLDGDHERAARLLGAADRQWRSVGSTLYGSPQWLRGREECTAAARGALGDVAFDKACADGGELSVTEAVRYALGSGGPVPDDPTGAPPDEAAPRLTPREREVAALIAEGLSNREIAARLVLSTRTAESHVENILRKLGFTSRTQVAGWLTQAWP
jgi:predicted ATPase/DNA-binding CsgD family transcriptional regulator